MKRRTNPGEWTVLAAGVLLIAGSLLTWYSLPRVVVLDGTTARTFTAWSRGFAPTTLLPLVLGLAVAVPVLLARLADLHLPERLGGMRSSQLRLVLAGGAVIVALCELATQRRYGPVSLSRGPGLWLTAVGAAAVLLGAVIDRRPATGAEPTVATAPESSDC